MRRGFTQLHIILIVVAVVVAFLAFPGGPFYSVLFSASDSGDVFAEGDGGSVLSGGNNDPCLAKQICSGPCVFGNIQKGQCMRSTTNGPCTCSSSSIIVDPAPLPPPCIPSDPVCSPYRCTTPSGQLGYCAIDNVEGRGCICDTGLISPGQPGKISPAPPGPLPPVINFVYQNHYSDLVSRYANTLGVVDEWLDRNQVNYPYGISAPGSVVTTDASGQPRIFYSDISGDPSIPRGAIMSFKVAVRDYSGRWSEEVIASRRVPEYFISRPGNLPYALPHYYGTGHNGLASFYLKRGFSDVPVILYTSREGLYHNAIFKKNRAFLNVWMAIPASVPGTGNCEGSPEKNWDCFNILTVEVFNDKDTIDVGNFAATADSQGNIYLVFDEGSRDYDSVTRRWTGDNKIFVHKLDQRGKVLDRQRLLSTNFDSTPSSHMYQIKGVEINPANNRLSVLMTTHAVDNQKNSIGSIVIAHDISSDNDVYGCAGSSQWFCSKIYNEYVPHPSYFYLNGKSNVYFEEYFPSSPGSPNNRVMRISDRASAEDTGLRIYRDRSTRYNHLAPYDHTFYALIDNEGKVRISALEYVDAPNLYGQGGILLADSVNPGTGNCGKNLDYSCGRILFNKLNAASDLKASVGP